jgi:FkbM family methyltransferase
MNLIWLCFVKNIAITTNMPTERLGSEYGGWNLCINGLSPNTIVYSFGIGEDISFDLALIKKYGCRVFAFDPTPRSIQWLQRQTLPTQFKCFNLGISDYDGEAKFFPPENTNFVSHTLLERPKTQDKFINVQVRRLSTILQELEHEWIDILKMDIEGAEYRVIKDMLSTDIRPNQILVEFHHFFKNVSLLKTMTATIRLWLHGYRLFALSPSSHEYSFIHKNFA